MDNKKRLAIALEYMLRDHTPEDLLGVCSSTITELVKVLPKERGGSKVRFEGRTRGRAVSAATKPSPRRVKAVGSLGVQKDATK